MHSWFHAAAVYVDKRLAVVAVQEDLGGWCHSEGRIGERRLRWAFAANKKLKMTSELVPSRLVLPKRQTTKTKGWHR
jgi:hypothetical protein